MKDKRQYRTIRWLLAAVLLTLSTALVAAEETAPTVSSLRGEEAPLEKVLASFLMHAYSERQAPGWVDFLGRFRIDPGWQSAELLGRVAFEISEEHRQRVNEAALRPDFKTADGLDPNEWRHEAVGRGFAEILVALRADGFDLPLAVFVSAIEEYVRPSVTYYSDEGPIGGADEVELFWVGAESVLPGFRAEVGQ